MNIILSAFLLRVALLTCAAQAGDTPWETYGEGDEQHRLARLYIIPYPADFEVDPQSDWGDVPRPRDPQIKSIEPVMMLHNPEHTLTVQACDYDMIWLKAEPEGIRNMLNAFDTIRTMDIREKYILVFAEKPERHLAYAARASSEQQEPLRMGEIPLAALAEIPAGDDVSRTDNTTKEFLALPAYESGNIPCLEYLLRRGLSLTDREGKRLNDELAGQQRPVVLALFLLYEPLTAQERERALADIRQDAVLQREVERIYAQHLRLNQEAGGHAPVTVTTEERSRRTEHHFFNTPDFSLL